ncbi:MAG: hypothetical protein B6I20_05500 [Bacteroidetes bacterium 4572_117]|nr:MAG: hypothetical protein B6I20_05500 [Bacteroidetes bacterium 4572_117]
MKTNIHEFQNSLRRLESVFEHMVSDVAVLAADQFDQNFERQSFFGQKWEPSEYVKRTRPGGSLLVKSGHLRRSIKKQISGSRITFISNAPYAEIHNQGGTINHPGGTAFFKKKGQTIWVSNRKAMGKKYPRTKPHKIEMPQRQFIGDHPKLEKMIEKEIEDIITKAFK